VRFARETWVEESGGAVINGSNIHMIAPVPTHANACHLICFFALSSSFSAANTRYFQPMHNGFTLTA
jgi:hypothetical protein